MADTGGKLFANNRLHALLDGKKVVVKKQCSKTRFISELYNKWE